MLKQRQGGMAQVIRLDEKASMAVRIPHDVTRLGLVDG
jgi:hypothetical protein